MTPIRRRVLEVVAASPAPMSAYAIIHQLSDAKLLGPPTVYRTLEFLVAAGFVRHLALRKALYPVQVAGSAACHVLLTCGTWGDTDEVAAEQMRGPVAQFAATNGFVSHGRPIEIEGFCAACRSATIGEAPFEPFNPERDTSSDRVL